MMREATKAALVICMATVSAFSRGQQPLPNLQVDLDGQPAKLSPVMLEMDTYLAPLRDTVSLLTESRGQVKASGAFDDVVIDGVTRVRIPINAKAGANVLVYDPANPTKVLRSIPVETYPEQVTLAGGTPSTFFDLELLAAAFGVSVNTEGPNMSLLTPKYWCAVLGIKTDKVGDRLTANGQFQPDFGISPPARTILAWVRPPARGFVQSYRIESGKEIPLLGQSALGDDVDVLTPDDVPKMRAASATAPLRFQTYNYGDSVGQTISFASIVVAKDLGKEDPISAINNGELKGNEWAVVGLRQRIDPNPVLFDNRPINTGETVEAFAKRNGNSAAIVKAINGVNASDKLPAGTLLSVIVGLDDHAAQATKYQFKGLYEVQRGDSLASLAQAWGVSTDDLLATNSNIPGGGEPAPGQLVNIISKIDNEPTKAASLKFPPAEAVVTGTAVTLLMAEVHETSQADSAVIGRIPKGTQVELIGRVQGWVYRVHYGEVLGYVPTAVLKLGAVLPKANPHDNKVANEALKYLGTPYLWGGNNLRSGIDCSHFVAQVYVHLGWKEPPPPVVTQENIGEMVECKEGPARRGGRTYNLPDQSHFPSASTNMNALEEGDRVIFQHGLDDATGSRHTGIYIGSVPDAWRARFGDVHYAFVHAGVSHGVNVGSLLDPYFWKIYKFSVRSGH